MCYPFLKSQPLHPILIVPQGVLCPNCSNPLHKQLQCLDICPERRQKYLSNNLIVYQGLLTYQDLLTYQGLLDYQGLITSLPRSTRLPVISRDNYDV